jgi:hypothetical protein
MICTAGDTIAATPLIITEGQAGGLAIACPARGAVQ